MQVLPRVTRTLFALGELTLADPDYTGPRFDLDRIAKEINDKVMHGRVVIQTIATNCCHYY